ncbi:unnamed protein product [Trifolium pratense]|uniref:Uncharacterized protein n=1 Tax=Trifolium pratense TaxID=57577 RepID=A0ACB0K901_TRIPR|nr:unnamed protein product [Trifolium pratense]
MQRRKNMTEVLKFIYAMILFLLFLVAIKVGGEHIFCTSDADCTNIWNEYYIHKCVDHECKWVWKWDLEP